MKPTPIASRLIAGRSALALAAVVTAGYLFAAPPPTPPVDFNPSSKSNAAKGEGLDSLDERALSAELSSRGIGNLLDYYFKANHVPESDQRAIKTVGALRELNGNGAAKINGAEKMRRVQEVADGIDAVLPTIKDPEQMMTTAATLAEFGVDPEVNNLEYWGEDPVTQAKLKPMASAVVKLFDSAGKLASKQAEALAAVMKGAGDPNADRWEKLDNLSHMAEYTKNMSIYADCLATSAKSADRKTEAATALKALADYDNPDSMVQARIRNMMARLNMVSGDYAAAKKLFATVYSDKTDIKPAPNPFEQYDARYFVVVADILGKDLPAAQADKASLDAWQTGPFKTLLKELKLDAAAIAASDKGVSSAGQMLQWRVHVLEGEMAKPGSAEKKKADDAAEAVLLALRASRPDLAGRIDQQLVNRMGDKPIDDKMASSLLLALLKNAMIESYKQEPEKPDAKVLQRGIDAATAIITRKDPGGLTAQNISEARLSIAVLKEKLGKTVDAINSYLDYATVDYKSEPKKAVQALDQAGFLVFKLKKAEIPPDGFAEAYNRFLPIAINEPYNHTELAYPYAEQLRGLKDFKGALRFLRMVPKNSPAFGVAMYKQMIVLDNLLDGKQDPAEHAQTVKDLTTIAQEVKQHFEASTDKFDRNKAINATLTLADLARTEEKDAAKTLKVLDGFEELVKGQPGEELLMRNAINARVNANMALGNTDAAVKQLTKLLENAKGDEGSAQVRALLEQLDKEYNQASLNGNKDSMRKTAKNEAMLTHYLVDWSNPATQKNTKVSQFYYAYAVYDARIQRIAGAASEDPAERKALLDKAAQQYRFLQSDDMHKLYLAMPDVKKRIDEGKADATEPDPNVATGLAFTAFDQGDFKTARDQLDPLIANKKLGTPQNEVIDEKTGEVKIKDNDLYWDSTYKFIKSSYEAAKGDPKLTEVVSRSLKNLLIRGGIPERLQDDFEGIRKAVCPDFNPSTITGTPAKPAPVASPKAAAAK